MNKIYCKFDSSFIVVGAVDSFVYASVVCERAYGMQITMTTCEM